MTPGERRRYERNQREQERSQKISQQIKGLRKVLTDSKVPFKQNKFSILMSVVDYIKHLQNRASLLDVEHDKLVNTIQKTNSLVNSGFVHRADDNSIVGNDAEMLYVQGIDYKAIFEQCSFPVGVAALDGRFLMINKNFERMTGFDQHQLESLTLFGLLATKDVHEVFRALGTLLKEGSSGSSSSEEAEAASSGDDANGTSSSGSESGSGTKQSDNTAGDAQDQGQEGHGLGEAGGRGGGGRENGYSASIGYWSGALKRPNQDVSWTFVYYFLVSQATSITSIIF